MEITCLHFLFLNLSSSITTALHTALKIDLHDDSGVSKQNQDYICLYDKECVQRFVEMPSVS